jgi:hypothetical protein
MNVAYRKFKMEVSPEFLEYINILMPIGEKLNKKSIYDDFYSRYPSHYKIEMTTFRNWLKYFADAYDFNFIESHSGSDNFFEINC